ncbi:ergosterol biosynthesis ERG4/ERG24 family domain-containing protein [Ditylenchus destructor]|uniref:7-dehydrocholesterol reductase n=1 Tax=Ditylenchus destructor TaxID=166010 RepID=A0AAD4NG49_9BILA|nr:ergosterol biosynthesis ERG4/ERG24 family domain-containing protein [Ditylenchus destructor]
MSFRLNRLRRSSSQNSNSVLSSRRSSISQKDFEHIQTQLRETKRLSHYLMLSIMFISPLFIFTYHFAITNDKGSLKEILIKERFSLILLKSEIHHQIISPVPWLTVVLLIQLQLLFLWFLPASEHGMTNDLGQKFQLKRNCFDSCVLICLLYILGAALGLYRRDIIFTSWLGIMFSLSLICVILQFYLYCCYFWEKSAEYYENYDDNGLVSRIFFGKHLQPVVLGVDVKQFLTNRIMFTLWAVYIISSLFHQKTRFGRCSNSLLTCSLLQLVYITRRQWFEYVTTNLDNQNDRMGFYRIWGVAVFLPTLYLTPITIMAQTDSSLSQVRCVSALVLGLFFQYLNSDIDLQKYRFRIADGMVKIANKDPFYITARYRKDNGELGTQLLLGSGYFGICRHFNHTTEIVTFLLWTLVLPKFYYTGFIPVIFLLILLYGRMHRDEMRCLAKYSHYWLQYTSKVKYLVLPGLY